MLGHTLNISLLILTFFFVLTTYNEYALGETNTVLSKQPLTTKDNPKVSICFGGRKNILFDADFTANYRYWNGSSWKIDQTMVRKLAVLDEPVMNCFMFKEVNEDISGQKKIYLEIIFKDETAILQPWVYITTEENSYGVVTQRWLDGEVFKFRLYKNEEFFVKLNSVHQFEYLKHLCSENSFYRCLLEKMVDSGDCSEHGGLCEAVSLPIAFPECRNSEAAHKCTTKAFWKAFNSTCKLEKSCSTMEYRIEGLGQYQGESRFTWENKNATFSFGYGFVPGASQERQIQPHKTVHSEYLVWSEFTLVAYIGGMLGLTLGISLLDTYYWIMNMAGKVWKTRCCLRRKQELVLKS